MAMGVHAAFAGLA
jgi:zinc transporter 1/2/3